MSDFPYSASPPVCLPARAQIQTPRHRRYAKAVDCHCHVYEDSTRYPYIAGRSYTPVPSTLEQYLEMCRVLGIDRTVQVSASVYGPDNSLTLDVMARLGPDRARGVAGLSPDVTHAELKRLTDAGMRGVRVSTHVKGYGGTDALENLATRIRPYGWHLQVLVHRVAELAELKDRLLRIPVPIVFDHMGGVRGDDGLDSPGFQVLLDLLTQRDDCWTKISSWYRRSVTGDPSYADMQPYVQALVAARADRLVFGTNWPHPALFAPTVVPDDGTLMDLFCDWVGGEGIIKQILVDNPARLYGFDD